MKPQRSQRGEGFKAVKLFLLKNISVFSVVNF